MSGATAGAPALTAAKRATTHPNASAFPNGLSGPALRALDTAGIHSLRALTRVSKADLLAMHGMGPKGVRVLVDALAERGLRLLP